jgi:hypothetical protein
VNTKTKTLISELAQWIFFGALFAGACFMISKCANEFRPKYTEPEVIPQNPE